MGKRRDSHAERVDSSDLQLELSPHFRRTCRSFDLRQETGKSFVRAKLNFFHGVEAPNRCEQV